MLKVKTVSLISVAFKNERWNGERLLAETWSFVIENLKMAWSVRYSSAGSFHQKLWLKWIEVDYKEFTSASLWKFLESFISLASFFPPKWTLLFSSSLVYFFLVMISFEECRMKSLRKSHLLDVEAWNSLLLYVCCWSLNALGCGGGSSSCGLSWVSKTWWSPFLSRSI